MRKHVQEVPARNDGGRRRKAQKDYLTADGREKASSTPVAPPIGYIKQPSMVENIRDMVRREMSIAAAEAGMETFEEADDFEVGDDYDPRSPYEELFDPPPNLPGMRASTEGKGEREGEGEAEPPSPASQTPKNQGEKEDDPAANNSQQNPPVGKSS